MKTKQILVSSIAMLIAIFAISVVMAGTIDLASLEVSVYEDTAGQLVASPSETIPVKVVFVSNEDLEDAKVKVWISGYKDDIEASTSRFDVIAGKTYIKTLDLKVPNVKDIDDLDEDLTLRVELTEKNDDYEVEYELTVQRDSYEYDLLSVEAPSKADAGEVIAIDVVLKNIGRKQLEDSFVIAKIPELGVYKKVYFGDIAPEDNYDDDDDAEDARERRVYLVIPADAESGEYELLVKASNYDATEEVVKSLTINGVTAEDAIDTSKDDEGVPSSIIILTVVLVIIFLVLLIVLIVLLTKKPEERVEDFGETSYY